MPFPLKLFLFVLTRLVRLAVFVILVFALFVGVAVYRQEQHQPAKGNTLTRTHANTDRVLRRHSSASGHSPMPAIGEASEYQRRLQTKIADKQKAIQSLKNARWSLRLTAINPVAWNHDSQVRWAELELDTLKTQEAFIPNLQNLSDLEGQLDAAANSQGSFKTWASLLSTQRLLAEFQKFQFWVLPLVGLYFAGPIVWAIFLYYGLAPHVAFCKPLRFAKGTLHPIRVSRPGRFTSVRLKPSESVICRNDWLVQYSGCKKRTRCVWSFYHLSVSLASRLVFCTSIHNAGKRLESLHLASRDPLKMLTEIRLRHGAEIVLYPHVVVAVRGRIQIRHQWRLLSVHAWLSGRFRYTVFCGTGSIYIESEGGTTTTRLRDETQHFEPRVTVGFTPTLYCSTSRTETFWPYFVGATNLLDNAFSGTGMVIRTHAHTGYADRPPERLLELVVSLIGKLFGF